MQAIRDCSSCCMVHSLGFRPQRGTPRAQTIRKERRKHLKQSEVLFMKGECAPHPIPPHLTPPLLVWRAPAGGVNPPPPSCGCGAPDRAAAGSWAPSGAAGARPGAHRAHRGVLFDGCSRGFHRGCPNSLGGWRIFPEEFRDVPIPSVVWGFWRMAVFSPKSLGRFQSGGWFHATRMWGWSFRKVDEPTLWWFGLALGIRTFGFGGINKGNESSNKSKPPGRLK